MNYGEDLMNKGNDKIKGMLQAVNEGIAIGN